MVINIDEDGDNIVIILKSQPSMNGYWETSLGARANDFETLRYAFGRKVHIFIGHCSYSGRISDHQTTS